MELPLDHRQVVEDVGVVEFEVVQDQRPRPVVHELGALVEKGGVVLVRLDDEKRGLAKAGRAPEVPRHAADQEAGRQAGILEYPGQQARRAGLAVGPRDPQHPAVAKQVLREPLGPGRVGQALIQGVLHLGVAPGHRVADDHEIRRRPQVIGVVPLQQFDPGARELVAHRRVDIGVRAADPAPLRLGELGQPPHEGAAYAEYVYVHHAAPWNSCCTRPFTSRE